MEFAMNWDILFLQPTIVAIEVEKDINLANLDCWRPMCATFGPEAWY